jgi:hypothetical protein
VQILNGIPNFRGKVGNRILSFDPLEYDPSKWVTWTASPNKYYNAGGGFGYAVGAEWYFNFGFPGVFFGMIWMGWLTAFMRNRSRKNTMWLIVACLYFGLLVTVVRNDIGYPLRTMMWPLVGYWILNFILRRTARSQGRPIEWGVNTGAAAGTFNPKTAPSSPAALPWPSQDQ